MTEADDQRAHLTSIEQMYARLAREVRRRRSELGLSQAALARRGELSLATLGAMERGKPRAYTAQTLAALDRALNWEVGHAQGILDEQKPAPADASLDQTVLGMLAEYREVLDDLRRSPTWQRDVLAVADELGDEDRELWMRLGRRLRR